MSFLARHIRVLVISAALIAVSCSLPPAGCDGGVAREDVEELPAKGAEVGEMYWVEGVLGRELRGLRIYPSTRGSDAGLSGHSLWYCAHAAGQCRKFVEVLDWYAKVQLVVRFEDRRATFDCPLGELAIISASPLGASFPCVGPSAWNLGVEQAALSGS